MAQPMINENIKKILEKKQYRIIGTHSAVKVCEWTKKAILNKGVCYKQQFYGIRTHLCNQMTTSLSCSNRCVFCWRDFTTPTSNEWKWQIDEPELIYEESIKAQQKLLSGFGGNPLTDKQKFKEAQNPMHYAISLTGEPTMYPLIHEFIDLLHRKSKTSFLVTNGQFPENLEKCNPTQMYISLDAPNLIRYKEIDHPVFKDYWDRFNRSLEILNEKRKKGIRTVLRITAIKGMNMDFNYIKEYTKLIEKANPKFIEVKAYMFIGASRQRMKEENMPNHQEIKEFSNKLAQELNFQVVDEKEDSRVCLIMEKDSKDRIMNFD